MELRTHLRYTRWLTSVVIICVEQGARPADASAGMLERYCTITVHEVTREPNGSWRGLFLCNTHPDDTVIIKDAATLRHVARKIGLDEHETWMLTMLFGDTNVPAIATIAEDVGFKNVTISQAR